MKRLDIQPTEENLFKTYVEDSIGRVESVNSFVRLLENIEDGCSIAIDSPWGNGKTFFVKQTKMIIDAINPNNPFSKTVIGKTLAEKISRDFRSDKVLSEPFITTYYDAWEHDDEDDPLLSIVYEMMKENYCINNIPNKKDWSAIISSIVDLVSERSISGIVDSLRGQDIFEEQRNKTDLRRIINEFLVSLLPENGNKLVVFIDELDRCSPDYAVKLLERIKHYLLSDSVVFVFSINQSELQHTIKKFYGNDFDACRYLDRFFDYRIELPDVNCEKYLSVLGIEGHKNLRESVCSEFLRQNKMSLREIPKFLSATKMAAYVVTDTDNAYQGTIAGNILQVIYSVIVPIIIGLRIIDIEAYKSFISGNDATCLENIFLSESLFGWIFPYLLDVGINYIKRESISDKDARKKVREFYNAIFVNTYDGLDKQVNVGKMAIDKTVRTNIIKAVNLASKYSTFREV